MLVPSPFSPGGHAVKSTRMLVLLALGSASALAAPVLTLDAALKKTPEVASVELALQEQQDARANLNRLLQDPLATPMEVAQARLRASLADARSARAPKAARAQIAAAYTSAVTAQAAVPLAQKSVTVAAKGLEIAQIRLKNGSATNQVVRDAQDRLGDARKSLSSAQANVRLAEDALRDLVGDFEKLTPVRDLPDPPSANVVDGVLKESTTLLQARQGVESAQLQLSVLDPSYTARKDIDAARSGLESARKSLTQAQSGERQNVQNLFDAVTRAWRDVTHERQAEATARAKLTQDQRRLTGGLISPFDLMQSELSAQQAAFGVLKAENEYVRSYYALLAGGEGSR